MGRFFRTVERPSDGDTIGFGRTRLRCIWQGLGRSVETCVAAHRECPAHPDIGRAAFRHPEGGPSPGAPPPGTSRPTGPVQNAAHALAHEPLAQGSSRRPIVRHLGWGLSTVLRYAGAARRQDTLRDNRPRPGRPDPISPTFPARS